MEEMWPKRAIPEESPAFRIWLCGTFRIERGMERHFELIRTSEWGGSSYPRLLLKALLCCPGRQARREALLEMLWPDADPEQATQNLNTATTKLRTVLRPTKTQESLLITEEDSMLYRVEGQDWLWADADEALSSLHQVERLGHTSLQALPLLEKTATLLSRGVLLEEEGGLWVSSRRATIDRARYRCQLWLAETYTSHRRLGQAEAVLGSLLEDDPLDEDVVCFLMELLHQQGMTHQAMRLYKQTCDLLEREGLIPTEAMKSLATRFRSEKYRPIVMQPHLSIDWGEAPSLGQFYGRESELAELQLRVLENHCRVVAVCGMGGIGKTSLAVAFVTSVKDSFEYVFWRSLQHAPLARDVLQDSITFFSDRQRPDLPDAFEEQLSVLLHYFREHRCLFVLDNCETVLQAGMAVGAYRDGYEAYGQLFQRLGEVQHQSCLILTSREEIKEVSRLEGSSAYSLHLPGVGLSEGRAILQNKGIDGSEEACSQLIHLYAGNPLALKLVTEPIQSVFNADIVAFLHEEYSVVSDIQDLLGQQFTRLSSQEQALMYWLAIEREPVSLETLWDNMGSFSPKKKLFHALASLRRRSMVHVSASEGITIQPVIMEYVTDEFVRQIGDELLTGSYRLFASHALIKAQSKEYIRETQMRLILAPIGERINAELGQLLLEQKLKQVPSRLQQDAPLKPSYAAGNLLNLLISLHYDLHGYDFSHLQIRQAFLQGVQLSHVNFAHADLSTSVFIDTFGSIFTVAFHPSHSLLAAGTASGEVRLWDIQTGVPLHTWQGHTDWIRSLAFSPDGRMIASGSEDKTIRIWDIESGQCFYTLQGHQSRIRSVTFSPDGTLVASGSEDETIRLWEVTTGVCINILLGHTDQVRTVIFQPHGGLVASGSEDETIRLWEVATGACIASFNAQIGPVFSLAFSPDGQVLAGGGNDRTVRLWDVESQQCLKVLQGHISRVRSVTFSPDGQTVASGSEDRMVRLWAVTSGQFLEAFSGHMNSVFSVTFNPEGTIVASGSEDQTIHIWDVFTGQCLRILRGYTNEVRAIAFSPDGTTIASGNEDHTVKLWKLGDGQVQRTLRGHQNRVRAVAFSPDGLLAASGSEDHTVKLWEVSTGTCLRTLQGHTNRVRSVTFSPDRVLLASGSEDHTVKLWSAGTGECVATLHGHTNKVRSIAFSPDGTLVASGSEDQTIRLWNVNTGICWCTLQEHGSWIWSLTFSPDGLLIASGCEDQTIRIWSVRTGECLKILRGHTDRVRSVAFSPDGTTIASGSEDQTVRLWDIHDGECVNVLRGHASWVWAVAFSPDGSTIAGGSHDGTIKIWQRQTGECLSTLRSSRPYEQMNIFQARGLTPALQSMLKALGAVENMEIAL